MQTSRSIALEVLSFFDSNGYISSKKVEMAISTLSFKDRAFCSILIFETLRKRIRIDYELSKYLSKPGRLPVSVLNALRMGALQLLFLDNVPPYAAIHSSVQLIGVEEFRRLANAVLRKLSSGGLTREVPAHVEHSHPEWLFDLWRGIEYITDLEGLMEYNQTPPLETYYSKSGERAMLENGYVFEKSKFSDLFVVFQKGRPADGIERRDEMEFILQKPGLPIFKYSGSQTARLNSKPWLFHTLGRESLIRSAEEIRASIVGRLKESPLEEFIYYSQALSLEENTLLVREIPGYAAIQMGAFLKDFGIDGLFDGYGYWLLPDSSPLPGYICLLGRIK
jgi:16S rRNA (cytosine967-C5)-methyltransferase